MPPKWRWVIIRQTRDRGREIWYLGQKSFVMLYLVVFETLLLRGSKGLLDYHTIPKKTCNSFLSRDDRVSSYALSC